LYLAAMLRRLGHDARLVRPQRPEDLGELPHGCLAGFSPTTLEYPQAAAYARWIRQHRPDVLTVIGGPHASALPQCPGWPCVSNAWVVGPGEPVIEDLVQDAAAGHPAFLYGRRPLKSLDDLPFPARDLIPGRHGEGVFAFENGLSENVITSRGCGFRCAFCASSHLWGGKAMYRSAASVLEEVGQIVDSGCRQIRFVDDNFTVGRKRLKALCDGMESLGLEWHACARADTLTPRTCELLARGGCRELSVGVESGDQRVLDLLGKRTTVKTLERGCNQAEDAGIRVRVLLMAGVPGESKDTPELTRDLLGRMRFSSVAVARFLPLPGTPVWHDPDRFDCEIISWDFRRYNQCVWTAEGRAEYEPLICNRRLSERQQRSNVERLERYVEETGRMIHG